MQAIIIAFDVILLLTSVVLIVAVLMQPGKSAGLSGAITGGAETFFGKNKAKSYEGKLALITKISAGVIFALSLVLVILGKLS
jgi:preprotein translocase subunit SecG